MAKPFSIGWYCVSDGVTIKLKTGQQHYVPPGAIVRFYEWYGWSGKEDQGCRLDPGRVAQRIKEIEQELGINVSYRVADTEMWATKGGPSPMDYFTREMLHCRQAVKDRIRNYNEVIARLAGNQDFVWQGECGEWPMLFVTSNCEHFWRTVPTLQMDPNDPEKGPNTKEEDHVYDELAYACASYPYITTKKQKDDRDFQEELERASPRAVPYQTIMRTNRQRSGRRKLWT
jgi:hypothetical protein